MLVTGAAGWAVHSQWMTDDRASAKIVRRLPAREQLVARATPAAAPAANEPLRSSTLGHPSVLPIARPVSTSGAAPVTDARLIPVEAIEDDTDPIGRIGIRRRRHVHRSGAAGRRDVGSGRADSASASPALWMTIRGTITPAPRRMEHASPSIRIATESARCSSPTLTAGICGASAAKASPPRRTGRPTGGSCRTCARRSTILTSGISGPTTSTPAIRAG